MCSNIPDQAITSSSDNFAVIALIKPAWQVIYQRLFTNYKILPNFVSKVLTYIYIWNIITAKNMFCIIRLPIGLLSKRGKDYEGYRNDYRI